ncbi:transcriptional regulator [Spirochaetia bacterium]|nr:transcriptional regulator [Spirochaetia bacterium]
MGNFKANLRNELDYQNLTVKELSTRTSISKNTLDCYLGIRETMPPADVAVKIADALGVTVEYLVTGREKGDSSFPNLYPRLRQAIKNLAMLDEKDRNIACNLIGALKERENTQNTRYQ